MTQPSVFDRILDFANRADPYPLYTELRRTPVRQEADGLYVVSTYREVSALRHDPRISSEQPGPDEAGPPPFIRLDPPRHDRARRLAMKHFGPPWRPDRVDGMRPQLHHMVTDLIDGFAGKDEVDIVADLAYPFPVSVICALLGVPRQDEPRFRQWVDVLVDAIDPAGLMAATDPATLQMFQEFTGYLHGLVDQHRHQPGTDLISAMATDDAEDRLSDDEIVSTSVLLLVAGHETTVNLIANGMLTFLRHPVVLKRLREDPEMIIPTVEEVLRYEPSVHMIPWRHARADIELAGTTIPKGAAVSLMLAAANRDPDQFPRPDTFDPDRGATHLSFGGGIHFCFGAALARLEAQIALGELVRRLGDPVLMADPPPYRPSPVLRGPRQLMVGFSQLA